MFCCCVSFGAIIPNVIFVLCIQKPHILSFSGYLPNEIEGDTKEEKEQIESGINVSVINVILQHPRNCLFAIPI